MTQTRRWIRRAARAAICSLAFAAGGLVADMESSANAMPVSRAPHRLAPVEVRAPVEVERPRQPAPPTLRVEPPDWSQGAILTGATPHRLIHFSFDDGPNRMTTPGLLAQLDELGIKATFFVTTGRMAGLGGRAEAERALLADIHRRGHSIGNHTVNHKQLPLLTPLEVQREIEDAADLIEQVTGLAPHLIRPPGGSRSARIDGALASMGYTQVLWNLGSGDFQVRTADEVVSIFERVLDRRERENGERGGIVLLHDTHPWSVAALPRMVELLRARNCDLLERGEELYDIVDRPDLFFVARGDDDSMVAPPAQPAPALLAARQQVLRRRASVRCNGLARNP